MTLPMRVLLGCIALHLLLADVVPSPWWVPDFTLVGLVMAVALAPHRWFVLAMLAGVAAMVWAIRFPGPILMTYLIIGMGVRVMTMHWDMADARVQALTVSVASLLVTLECLWLHELWSLSLLGLTGVHVVMTVLAVPVTRRVLL